MCVNRVLWCDCDDMRRSVSACWLKRKWNYIKLAPHFHFPFSVLYLRMMMMITIIIKNLCVALCVIIDWDNVNVDMFVWKINKNLNEMRLRLIYHGLTVWNLFLNQSRALYLIRGRKTWCKRSLVGLNRDSIEPTSIQPAAFRQKDVKSSVNMHFLTKRMKIRTRQ